MSKADEKALREQRLAIKLRENLKRRKGQAKARAGSTPEAGQEAPPEPQAEGEDGSKAS